MVKLSAIFPIVLIVSGCTDFDEPAAVDPTPVVGCYIAPDAPSLRIQLNGVRIEQSPQILPFQYEQAKVGMVLAIPMVASVGQSGFELGSGDEHFYRVLWINGGPVIRVAFAPDGIIRDYERSAKEAC